MKLARGIAIALAGLLAVGGAAGCAQNSQGTDGDTEADADEASSPSGGAQRQTVKKQVDIVSQLPDVIGQTLPGVVGLSTKRVVRSRPSPFPFRGMPRGPEGEGKRRQSGMGSGVVVDGDGTILTNHHVVQRADEIKVSFSNRHKDFRAEIVGTDEATDIAVLRLDNPPEDLKPIPFGDSSSIELGEPVVAIGQPFGLSGTVTYGIVSAKGRQNVGLAEYEDFIQTDAAINPGNSGGALVNMNGELIGINTAILSRTGGYQGIGFAIPASMAQSVMQQLIDNGEVERGHLGVLIQTLSPELAEAFDLSNDTQGVVVSKVQENSPAAQAGLRQGDVIVRFDGQKVASASDLRNRVAHTAPGTSVEVTLRRDGQKKTVPVELSALGASGGKLELDRQGMLKGLVLSTVDQKAREQFDLPERLDQGIVVMDVNRGSPAARTGLRPGDVLLEVNKKELTSIDQFTNAYEQAERRILLLVYRDGNTLFLAIPKVDR